MSVPVLTGVLARHAKQIAHLRQAISRRAVGVVVGSAIHAEYGVPRPAELRSRIHSRLGLAEELDLNALDDLPRDLLSAEEGLLSAPWVRANPMATEFARRGAWRRLVHQCLYKDDASLGVGSWNSILSVLVQNAPLTIDLSISDTLERLVVLTDEHLGTRRIASRWQTPLSMGADSTILHIRGFLPREGQARGSDTFELADSVRPGECAIRSIDVDELRIYFSRATMILLGDAVDDPFIASLLEAAAVETPGCVQYHITSSEGGTAAGIAEGGSPRSVPKNIVRFQLNPDELSVVADLLRLPDQAYSDVARMCDVEQHYRYIVTGAVSVGKSTTVAHFDNLHIIEEWLEERAPGMDKSPSRLSLDAVARIDSWVALQVAAKNELLASCPVGITLIDRGPLDAFGFTPLEEWPHKALRIRSALEQAGATHKLLPAHVILLLGDEEVLAARSFLKFREFSPSELALQQQLLQRAYGIPKGVTVIDTRGLSIQEVVGRVARIVFGADAFEPARLHERLVGLETP